MTSTPRFFGTLADRTRLRIVNLLARGPLCVCDIQYILEQPQSSVSRHLAHLRAAGLVEDRRDGMRTFYDLTAWESGLPRGVLETLRRELKADPEFGRDLESLELLKASGEYHKQGKLPSIPRGRISARSRPRFGASSRPRPQRTERVQR